MTAAVGPAAGRSGGAPRPGAKGPAGRQSEGSKKVGRGAAGATGRGLGMPSTKAKRPGGK